MAIIAEPERTQLYTRIRHLLGAPLRSVELEDEQMDSLLELSIGDYSQYIQDWLVESQWTSLANLNLDTQSLSRAFITKSLDYETRYTYAYSKIVGLQAGGDWELKKDYIELVRGQQIYEIPAGREINEIMWYSDAERNSLLFDPFSFAGGFAGGGFGGAGGFSQMGMSGSYFMMPVFDMLLRMQEINIQRRIIGGDLTYRITALPEGKKALHLMQTPGGKFDFGNGTMMRGRVWYWYYDAGPADRDKCLKDNPDIIKLPSDVPLDTIDWVDLNNPAQVWIRRWFTAYCKETLSRVRGKFSGNIKTPDSELTMDYTSLATEAKDEKTKLIEELIGAEGKLTRLRPDKVMEREALLAENLNKQLKFRANAKTDICNLIYMTFITRKIVGKKIFGSMSNLSNQPAIQIITIPEYRTNGEEFILVKDVDYCKILLDQSSTEHVVIKALTKVLIVPFMGLIDEQYDEILIDKGAAVEFFRVDGGWYILSSDGLKLE